MTVNSVNNYQQYRKEYIRLSTAINRGKEKGLDISKLFAQREQLKSVYSIQPNSIQSTVYNNERIHLPVNKVNKPQTVYQVNKNNEELKTLILELKSQLAQFSQLPAEIQTLKSELTELKNELVNLVTSSLTSKLTNPNSSLKKTASLTKKPTLTKLTPSEWLKKRRAYDRARNKTPQRRAQLAQYKKNARLKKKLEREGKMQG